MFFVVGLGNPGAEYEGTRHNVGFEVVEALARRHGFSAGRRFHSARVYRGSIKGHEGALVKPMTYMNLSGDAVAAVLGFHKGTAADLIVVHDELDFAPGQVRVKVGGGHGGHNGLRSIIAHAGRDFARVRVGVGKPPAAERGADHVLSRFDAINRKLIDGAIAQAADAVEVMVAEGAAAAMNRFNRREDAEEVEQ
ncbi:MAG: aminoacyl-tRNA hydrolase [Deltaproteobacteria bacterium]|nr:aminoacyl-tRNA hydrolase [Deltaproteobacteria bacterium]